MLDWRVRENLKGASEPLILPGKRKSYKPTGEMLLALLQSIQLTLQTRKGATLRTPVTSDKRKYEACRRISGALDDDLS
ncbi:hypothetical protein [Cohnella fermenti]|uniref:Uncharacterized protein n=1 Tax=Cohnella fermenti TaxID=2565925 RepID=A0A4S4BEG1_9BACL|nr:hypothetical protein [Cohnella fermenti]THF72492.1 hypothetical protein E6C55_32945 [Cohnella fermenti]